MSPYLSLVNLFQWELILNLTNESYYVACNYCSHGLSHVIQNPCILSIFSAQAFSWLRLPGNWSMFVCLHHNPTVRGEVAKSLQRKASSATPRLPPSDSWARCASHGPVSHTYTCAHVRTNTHTHMQTHTCTHTHARTHTHTHTQINTHTHYLTLYLPRVWHLLQTDGVCVCVCVCLFVCVKMSK